MRREGEDQGAARGDPEGCLKVSNGYNYKRHIEDDRCRPPPSDSQTCSGCDIVVRNSEMAVHRKFCYELNFATNC